MKKMRIAVASIAIAAMTVISVASMSGCAAMESFMNDLRGEIVGNSYNIEFYDNYGELTMTTTGDKISLSNNKSFDGEGYTMSSVVTINIDGHEIETCGDTAIFAEDGLEPDVSGEQICEIASETNGDLFDNTFFSYYVNRWANMIGKSRAVVIKSQMGRPLSVYSGDKVYYDVRDDLPKTTKLMIDGKALYIHRANFQIIDTALLR